MKKIFLYFLFSIYFIFQTSYVYAAKVSCDFDSGESYSITDGSWQGSLSYETLWDLFPDGLSLELENSLLAKLDAQEIFKAGKTEKGDVYLMGSEIGITGRMSVLKNGSILIYAGYCDVGFG